jgi:hypothetical protein
MQAYFDHIANLPAEAPVVAKATPATTAPASTIPAKQAASVQSITSSTKPLAAQSSAKAAPKSVAKADVPMPKVLKQASQNTQPQIQIPLKPQPQNTESTAPKVQDK